MPSKEALVIARTHCSQCLLKATTEYLCGRCEYLAIAIDVAKREVAEALIRAGCLMCEQGIYEVVRGNREWLHVGTARGWIPEHCDSSGLHELLHQLKEREDADK